MIRSDVSINQHYSPIDQSNQSNHISGADGRAGKQAGTIIRPKGRQKDQARLKEPECPMAKICSPEQRVRKMYGSGHISFGDCLTLDVLCRRNPLKRTGKAKATTRCTAYNRSRNNISDSNYNQPNFDYSVLWSMSEQASLVHDSPCHEKKYAQ